MSEIPSGTPGTGTNQVVQWIGLMVGAAAALATGVTSLAVTGSIGRVQRNHPTWFAFAIGLVVAAGACWLVAAALAQLNRTSAAPADDAATAHPTTAHQTGSGASSGQKFWTLTGIALAAAGVIIGFFVSVNTAGEPERPIVSLHLDPATLTLGGTAKVRRLSSTEPLTVTVDGMVRKGAKLVITQRLAESSVGPNDDGEANQDIFVHVPAGQFDVVGVRATTKDDQKPIDQCGSYPTAPSFDDADGGSVSNVPSGQEAVAGTAVPDATTSVPAGTEGIQVSGELPAAPETKKPRAGTGCQYVSLPPATVRPPLSSRWLGSGRRTLLVTAATPNVAASGDQRPLLHLDVVASDGKRVITLARVVRDPVAPGQTIPALRIPVPASARTVCAWASLDPTPLVDRAPCPLSAGAERFKGAGASAFQLMGPAALRTAAKKKVA
jgi:uncharacterized membrane protein